MTTVAAQPTRHLIGATTAPASLGMGASLLSAPIASTPFDEVGHQQIPQPVPSSIMRELVRGAPAFSMTTFAVQPTPQLLGAAIAPAGTGMGVSPFSTPIAPMATPFDEENHQQIPRAEFRRAWDVYQTRERAVKRRYEADTILDKGDLDGAAVYHR